MNDVFPKIIKIRQRVHTEEITDFSSAFSNQINRADISTLALEGKRIGITAGSRGIDHCAKIVKALCDCVKTQGGEPVIIPAMGSHGGGTETGQIEVLKGLGITEKNMGACIRPCTESVCLGETPEKYPVFCNKMALKMDHLILFNRIKKHTDFTGTIESGLHKIMTIGLGGPAGAEHVHRLALRDGYEKVIVSIAQSMLEKLPVLFGFGALENARCRLNHIETILPQDLYAREAALLVRAKAMDITLPFDYANVLVVGEVGKDISGGGMEGPKIGRIRMLGQTEPSTPVIDRIVALSLTEASHGNATGLGLADITTRRVLERIDFQKTALNCLISMGPNHAAIPCITESDRDAIAWALKTVGLENPAANARLAFIQNTKHLETLAVSESLLDDMTGQQGLEVIGGPESMDFDKQGNFLNYRYEVI